MPTHSWIVRRLLLAVLVAMALVAASCGEAEDSDEQSTEPNPELNTEADAGTPQPGGEIAIGVPAETNSWDPHLGQWGPNAYLVANTFFDPLTAIDDEGEARPYLAESLEANDDFTEWTIALRPDITFHNGEPLNGEALRANLESARTSALTATSFAAVESVSVVDDLTVVLALNTPWATLPLSLTSQAGYIAAPEMLASDDGGSNPIGTGPFVFDEWIIDSSLTVTKNDGYWQDGLPYLDGIEFQILADSASRTEALRSGNLQAMQVTTPTEYVEWSESAADDEYQFLTDAGLETDETIIAFNTSKPPFDDPIARQAIAYGINQDQIAETLWEGAFEPARTPFAEGSPFYVPPEELGYPEYDLARAQELVAEYEEEYGEPLRFSALIPPEQNYQQIAQALQAEAANAGIEVELVTVEQTQLITDVLGGNYEAAGFVLWSAPSLDRGYPFLGTAPADGLSLNFTRFDDPELRAAMDAARATDDQDEQIEQYRIVQERLAEDLDKIFLVHNAGGVVFDNTVHGFARNFFPGTDTPSYSGYGRSAPFSTSVWIEQ